MKKFSEIEDVRPDMVAEQERIKEYTEALKGVRSYEELRGLFMEEKDRKSTRLNSSHNVISRMPSSA